MKKFVRDNNGVAALEFAIIAPVLILFIFAILELSSVMLASAVLESAVRVASRAGITGYTPPGVTRDAYVKQVVDANLVHLKASKLTFETKIYNSFANIGQPEPYIDSNGNGVYNIGETFTDVNGNLTWDSDMGASGAGDAGAIVVYKVTYPWKIITPGIAKFFGENGAFNITASMVVRNEPYDN